MDPFPPTLDETLAHTEWVRRLARSLVNDADADDLAQDAWEASLSAENPSRGWFAGALRNLAAFRHRTTARRLRRDATVETPEPEPTADVVMERLEAHRQLTTLVSELPEPTRTVLYLRYFEGLDATSIGERLKLPAGTVRWRLKQGVDTLRGQLDERLGRERWSALLLPIAPKGAPLHLTGVMLMKLKHAVVAALAVLLALIGAFAWNWSSSATPSSEANVAKRGEVARVAPTSANAVERTNSPVPAWRGQTDAPHRKVAGRVMLDGAPRAGAVVTLTVDEQPNAAPPQERVTAADGTFDFGVQSAVAVGVGAFVAGHAPAIEELDLRNPETRPDALELVIPSGCPARLTGRVFDSGAGPVANASVRPTRTAGAHSDAQGAYELCLPLGESELVVEAAGYGAITLRLTLDGPLQRDVVLTPEATIEGVVVDEAQRPVADAIVSANQRMWQNNDRARRGFAQSNALGRFTMTVAPGDYRVQATAAGTGSSAIQVVSALVGEPSRSLTLVVKAGVRVRGIVMSNGKPVPGAKVTAHTVATGRGVDAFSQNDGRFVIDGVPPGELVFTAEPWAVEQPRRYLAKADAPEVTLQVQKMASLRGVVTRQKTPVAGAKIVALSMWGELKTVSDEKGRYTLEGLHRGSQQITASSQSAGAFVIKTLIINEREQLDVDLEMASAAFIDGTLVDEKNKPIIGARVVWTSASQSDEATSTTDDKGHFHAAQLSGGETYAPQVYLSGQTSGVEAKPVTAFPKVKLADGEAKAENVRLQVKVEKVKLSGRVVDLQGNPVADAKVRAKPAGGGADFSPYAALPQVFSDAQGHFAFDALQSGTWSLQARSPRGEEAVAQGETGGREVVITLHPTASVEGKLVGYRNTPVVYANQGQGRGFVAGQVTGETFHLTLTAGTWTITAMDNLEGDIQKITLKDGETRELTMQSHGMGRIRGQVTNFETGQPLSSVMCRAILSSGNTPGVTNWDPASVPMSDETGRCLFESAPAGHVLVAAMEDNAQSGASVFVDLASGGEIEVALKVVLRAPDAANRHGIELYGDSLAITAVRPESPAAKAGVQAGDVLLTIDGKPVNELGPQVVGALLDNRPAGSVVTVSLQRESKTLNVALPLP